MLLFDAHLELYGRLYKDLHGNCISPVQLSSIERALHGLNVSHDELCAVQQEEQSVCIRRLMVAVRALWKKVILKNPSYSDI